SPNTNALFYYYGKPAFSTASPSSGWWGTTFTINAASCFFAGVTKVRVDDSAGTAATGVTKVPLSEDQLSAAQTLPFSFTFFGTSYTQFYICSNGFITFSAGQSCDGGTVTAVGNAASPNNLIAVAWADLDPQNDGDKIKWWVEGTTPYRKAVI